MTTRPVGDRAPVPDRADRDADRRRRRHQRDPAPGRGSRGRRSRSGRLPASPATSGRGLRVADSDAPARRVNPREDVRPTGPRGGGLPAPQGGDVLDPGARAPRPWLVAGAAPSSAGTARDVPGPAGRGCGPPGSAGAPTARCRVAGGRPAGAAGSARCGGPAAQARPRRRSCRWSSALCSRGSRTSSSSRASWRSRAAIRPISSARRGVPGGVRSSSLHSSLTSWCSCSLRSLSAWPSGRVPGAPARRPPPPRRRAGTPAGRAGPGRRPARCPRSPPPPRAAARARRGRSAAATAGSTVRRARPGTARRGCGPAPPGRPAAGLRRRAAVGVELSMAARVPTCA